MFCSYHTIQSKKSNSKQREKGSVGNGWLVQGLQKFNEIAQQVKMDRNNFGDDFNREFKLYMDDEANKNKKSKHKREEVHMYNDLNESDKLHDEDDGNLPIGDFDQHDLLPIEEV